MQRPATVPACQKPEDVVIIEDDADVVTSESMVRSIQMAEDEAYARSLQVSQIRCSFRKAQTCVKVKDAFFNKKSFVLNSGTV